MQIGDKRIFTYFKIGNQPNTMGYMMYSKDSEINSIYVSSVYTDGDNYKLVKPNNEEIDGLKSIIQCLISDVPNSNVFIQNGYQLLDLNSVDPTKLIFEGSQKAQLSEKQYMNLLSSKYIQNNSISVSNNINNDNNNISNNIDIDSNTNNIQKDVDSSNDSTAFLISAITLGLFFSFLIIRTPHFLDVVFKFEYIWLSIATFDFKDIFTLTSMTGIVFQLSIIVILLAYISYNSEESHPIKFYFINVIGLFMISVIYFWSKGLLTNSIFAELVKLILKVFAGYALVNALIITLIYFTVNCLTNIIIEKIKAVNFLTYYAIFLALFLILFLGVTLFYDYYILNHVTRIIGSTILGGL